MIRRPASRPVLGAPKNVHATEDFDFDVVVGGYVDGEISGVAKLHIPHPHALGREPTLSILFLEADSDERLGVNCEGYDIIEDKGDLGDNVEPHHALGGHFRSVPEWLVVLHIPIPFLDSCDGRGAEDTLLVMALDSPPPSQPSFAPFPMLTYPVLVNLVVLHPKGQARVHEKPAPDGEVLDVGAALELYREVPAGLDPNGDVGDVEL